MLAIKTVSVKKKNNRNNYRNKTVSASLVSNPFIPLLQIKNEALVLKSFNHIQMRLGVGVSSPRAQNQAKERGARPAGLVVSIVSFGYSFSLWLVPYTYGKANLKGLAITLQVVCEIPKDRNINRRALGEKCSTVFSMKILIITILLQVYNFHPQDPLLHSMHFHIYHFFFLKEALNESRIKIKT